jgi:drug/metabolite transporter (DMT)-like permease
MWGFSFIFLRIAVPSLGPAVTTFCRLALAFLLIGGLVLALRVRMPWRTHGRKLLFCGLLNSAIPFFLFGFASKELPAGYLSVLNGTAALFSTVLAMLWMKHAMTATKVAGLLLGLAGVAVLVGLTPLALTPAVWLAIGAGLLGALFYAVSGNYVGYAFAGVSPIAVAFGSLIGATVFITPFAAFNVPAAAAWSPNVIIAILFLGIVTTGVAYLLYFRLLDKIGVVSTSTIAFLIPVFALIWGRVFLGEPITASNVIGGGLVLAGVALVNGMLDRKKAAA